MRNIYLGFLFRFDGVFVVNRTWKMCFATLHKSNCISWCKFAFYFAQKKLLFQFYALIFTKHPHQFIYSTHLFNKIFVFLQFFLTLPHRPSLSQTNTLSQTQTQHAKKSSTEDWRCFRWRPVLTVPVIKVACFFDRSSYAHLSTENPGPSSLFCC